MTVPQETSATSHWDVPTWRSRLLERTTRPDGARFAGLFGSAENDGGVRLTAVLFAPDAEDPLTLQTHLPADDLSYEALSPLLPAAFWYERALHDLFGVEPKDHPRLDPLLLPLTDPANAPLPGTARRPIPLTPDESAIPRAVTGPGVFTIPHGPVRSGVLESVEYLVETPGEDIPRIQIRVFHKHRGASKNFEQRPLQDAVLVAERVEGIASVAHALAFCHAAERLAGTEIPWAARLVRCLHAELERITNHLDVMVKLTDAAGLAVATARFGLHKERMLRLIGQLCGSRFGRSVIIPGGVHALPALGPDDIDRRVARLHRGIASDWQAAMTTPSFLDRLRTTGPLDSLLAHAHGALGPVGKASGCSPDARYERPYDAYPSLGLGPLVQESAGDALARTQVRGTEIEQSFRLLRQITEELRDPAAGTGPLEAPMPTDLHGEVTGWAEAPQGEVLYLVRFEDGRVARCVPRSASFHNLVLFHEVFAGDILTDFPFIEASFGLSIAGVAL
ncbi:NADH-quinone oxidoreductase subunit C [Streptomyces sp. NPDC004680]|uniref:hydrogenase large subunit n=1 Tax=Streptomyces sp. NPDC004680 TaxID=3154287 RepID=UPI0033B950A3